MTTANHRCRHCGSPMRVSARAYEENPFCAGCYHQRAALATAGLPPMRWRLEGEYLVPVAREEP